MVYACTDKAVADPIDWNLFLLLLLVRRVLVVLKLVPLEPSSVLSGIKSIKKSVFIDFSRKR